MHSLCSLNPLQTLHGVQKVRATVCGMAVQAQGPPLRVRAS